jgi:hypothetical protein
VRLKVKRYLSVSPHSFKKKEALLLRALAKKLEGKG